MKTKSKSVRARFVTVIACCLTGAAMAQSASGTRPATPSTGAGSGSNTKTATPPRSSGTTTKPSTGKGSATGTAGTNKTPATNQPGATTNQPGTTTTQPGTTTTQPGTTTTQPGSTTTTPGGTATSQPRSTTTPSGTHSATSPGTNPSGAPLANATMAGGFVTALTETALAMQGQTGVTNYTTTPSTVFTNSNGRPVSRTDLKKDTPVTVYYAQDGNQMVASKVVVDVPPPKFSAGTLTEVSPGVLVMKMADASPTPVRYVNNETTNYVDENGKPVPPESVKSGTPVKVYYTKVGDTLVASRVEVQREGIGLPKPPIESEATSTTTTTTTTTRGKKR